MKHNKKPEPSLAVYLDAGLHRDAKAVAKHEGVELREYVQGVLSAVVEGGMIEVKAARKAGKEVPW